MTLTTDFGLADHYVGVMKGVILGLAPAVRIVDITHLVRPQNVTHGAVVLAQTLPFFPPGSIHVAVVDPGVGGDRRVLLVETREQFVLVPDNGLATLVIEKWPPARITSVEQRRYFLPEVSRTFHGRDIFAPVAGHLARGVRPSELGPAVTDPVLLDWPRPREVPGGLAGEVLYADHFGNLVTNIEAAAVAAAGAKAKAKIAGHTCPVAATYASASPGDVVALVGSSGFLEVSRVNGSAAETLGAGAGTAVTLLTATSSEEDH